MPAPSKPDDKVPMTVLVAEEQHPIPVVLTAPDGVTPVAVPSLGVEENTVPGEDSPVPGYVPAAAPVATGTPVNVTVMTPPPPATVTKGEGTTLSPTTTEAEDTTTEGQRKVNLIWELTQAGISVLITGAVVYCAVQRIPSDNLANAFFLIIGFYFSRTNHQAIGGIGAKPSAPYIGRVI